MGLEIINEKCTGCGLCIKACPFGSLTLEMRDKLGRGELIAAATGGAHPGPVDSKLRDVLLALVSLGYKQAEAQRMVKDMAGDLKPDEPLEDVLRRVLSGRR